MYSDGTTEFKQGDGGEEMTRQSALDLPLWVLVTVESGIPVAVEAYADRLSAKISEQRVRKQMRPENDETAVFEVQLVHKDPSRSET